MTNRRLGNISGHHYFPANGPIGLIGGSTLENPLLEVGREGGVEGCALQIANLRTKVFHLPGKALASLINFLEKTLHFQFPRAPSYIERARFPGAIKSLAHAFIFC